MIHGSCPQITICGQFFSAVFRILLSFDGHHRYLPPLPSPCSPNGISLRSHWPVVLKRILSSPRCPTHHSPRCSIRSPLMAAITTWRHLRPPPPYPTSPDGIASCPHSGTLKENPLIIALPTPLLTPFFVPLVCLGSPPPV